jgi:ectoine hydroxylase-related dioxygenase (phytanoyl-CoA dioxygenase family)
VEHVTAVAPDLGDQLADVNRRLDDDGYAIVEQVLTRDEATEIGDELRRLLDGVPTGRNFFEGFKTRRLYAAYGKTRVLDALTVHPLVLGALEHVLGPHFQLSGPTAIEIGPGEVGQVLHRDDDIYPIARPHPQLVTNVMWALDDFTLENGATRLVRGSQHTLLPPPDDVPVVDAVMPAGSVMLYVGSLWHGGGANRTDRSRLGVAIEYVVSWLRAQETQLLCVPQEIARTLPKRMRELLGYNIYPPFVGYVDGVHPDRVLGIGPDDEPEETPPAT